MERILQEITAVSRRIEGMDASISSLTLETKSIRTNIAGFHSRVMGLESRVETLETHMSTIQDRDQDLSYLRSKVTDLEDRSRRDNIRLLGIPENEEGTDVQTFLSSTIPKLTSLAFEPPLEFQRAHRVGPKRQDGALRPWPIIACLLRHFQTRQILQAAPTHGPFRMDKLEVRITADYSKDTTKCSKAFLSLRPLLRQLEERRSSQGLRACDQGGKSCDLWDRDRKRGHTASWIVLVESLRFGEGNLGDHGSGVKEVPKTSVAAIKGASETTTASTKRDDVDQRRPLGPRQHDDVDQRRPRVRGSEGHKGGAVHKATLQGPGVCDGDVVDPIPYSYV
ncbi:hypothetical protein NDU88_009009 [Pleurodeles waltl]|uniref:Uncharacterized protein n=1 Tax=Pleurodeles waltl TaxID=8319 RepID=A0AAV7PR04_PLEWA|nr:hypothetical protein NDU88_009009 [Pleurodeles waltl]